MLVAQSRVGPVPWLQPYTDDKIRELGASGVEKMVVVPISFVSEHIETLEEIDMEYAEVRPVPLELLAAGGPGRARVPRLPMFVLALGLSAA